MAGVIHQDSRSYIILVESLFDHWFGQIGTRGIHWVAPEAVRTLEYVSQAEDSWRCFRSGWPQPFGFLAASFHLRSRFCIPHRIGFIFLVAPHQKSKTGNMWVGVG